MTQLADTEVTDNDRIQSLASFETFDTPAEPFYNHLSQIVALVCKTPAGLVTLSDNGERVSHAFYGLEHDTSSQIAESFGRHTMHRKDMVVVEDTLQDERFAADPNVVASPKFRFFAGIPLRTNDGQPLGSLCVFDTKTRSLNDEQRQCLCTLAQQSVERFILSELCEQLANALKTREEFLRIANHDLNNALSVIIGGTCVVEELITPGNDHAPEYQPALALLRQVEHMARHMHGLVRNYIDNQALDDNRVTLDVREADLAALVKQTTLDEFIVAQAKETKLVLDLPSTPVLCHLDTQRITQVVTNFLSNAIKFSPPSSEITVRVRTTEELPSSIHTSDQGRPSKEMALVEVHDSGPGLTREDAPKLFRKYSKLSATSTAGESCSGLGLNIARKLVQLHRGAIGAYNHNASGAIFWFALPLSRATN